MKNNWCILLLSFVFVHCTSIKPQQNHEQNRLALQLCEIYGSDQGIRSKELQHKSGAIMPTLDSLNFTRLVKFVQEHGMPTAHLVGKENYEVECVRLAAFSILFHNPEKIVHNAAYYNLFLNEVNSKRMSGEAFALLIDKYYWARKKNVLYGGQFGKPCITDKLAVNQRRNILGLKELEDADFKACEE